jgi:hypothetical protein
MFPRVRRWRSIGGLAAALLAVGSACSGGGGGGGGHGDDASLSGISLEAAFGGRTFSAPVKLVQHPTNDHRWYVVEQGGLVKTFLDTDTAAATIAATVGSLGGDGEQGLLGLAFDPGFATSGEVYLAYTDSSNRLVLARWVSANNGLTFTSNSVVLSIPHTPSTNHNGSDIMFGSDGFLYYSTGDGGGSDDPEDNAQNRNKLLGKILRIDVNATPPAGKTYAIPVTNPNHLNAQCNAGPGTAPCPEIFALGFRNPWRMNFDPATHKLYVGDVGQGAQEEIDLVTIGGNYGWDCLEGERDHSSLSGRGVQRCGRSDVHCAGGGVQRHVGSGLCHGRCRLSRQCDPGPEGLLHLHRLLPRPVLRLRYQRRQRAGAGDERLRGQYLRVRSRA